MNWLWPVRWVEACVFGESEARSSDATDNPIEVEVPVSNTSDSPSPTTPDTPDAPVLTRDQRLDTHIHLEIGGHITINGWKTTNVYENTTTGTEDVDPYPPPVDNQ